MRDVRRHDGRDRFRRTVFKIYETPIEVNRAADVQELAERAFDLLSHGNGDGAERLLKQALKLEPDACDLRNNLCAAYEMQGRGDEAESLVREIHDRNPQYFFGRTNLAQLCNLHPRNQGAGIPDGGLYTADQFQRLFGRPAEARPTPQPRRH